MTPVIQVSIKSSSRQLDVDNHEEQQDDDEDDAEEEEVQVLHPLSYMSGNLKKKMEEVLGCRCLDLKQRLKEKYLCVRLTSVRHKTAGEEDRELIGLKER